jgi:hypothetical protein
VAVAEPVLELAALVEMGVVVPEDHQAHLVEHLEMPIQAAAEVDVVEMVQVHHHLFQVATVVQAS